MSQPATATGGIIHYEVTFEEAWRIASGEGAGRHLDSLVRLDGLGLPFLPGTTVRGIARDALRSLADPLALRLCTLDGPWCLASATPCAMCALFGSPAREGLVAWGPARLAVGAPGLSEDARGTLASHIQKEASLTLRSHPRTAVDARSGRAEDAHLFALQEALRGLTLEGSIELREGLASEHVGCLVAALRFVREIGGSRRRGLGACRFAIVPGTRLPLDATWDEALRNLLASSPTPEPSQERSVSSTAGSLAPATNPTRISDGAIVKVEARVVGEVVLSARPEAANLAPGLAYLPGTALRGALAERWTGDRAGPDFSRCFLSGDVRFGFLHPEAGYPLPLSWHQCKLRPAGSASEHPAVDLLGEPSGLERCRKCAAALIPVGPLFGFRPGRSQPRLALSPHNRIDFDSQTVRDGSLFSYEALSEGTTLTGHIRATDANLLNVLLRGVGDSVAGTSEAIRIRAGKRKGTLGHLSLRFVSVPPPEDGSLAPDAEAVPDSLPASRAIRIDLLTPAIVLDSSTLRFRTSIAPEDLGLASDRAFSSAFSAHGVVWGWHGLHCLPKSEQLAVSAGSCYLITDVTEPEFKVLCEAARRGIGIRREEGFGVVAVRPVVAPPPAEEKAP